MMNHSDNQPNPTYYKPNPSALTIVPLEPVHAAQVCEWKYEPPYERFNWPSWEQMQKDEIEFGDPVLRMEQYGAFLDERLTLIGYAQFFPMGNVTRLGLGLRPDLCGLGLGPAAVRRMAEEALMRSPGCEIDLEVQVWNTRAIRAYEKAGFAIADTYLRPMPGEERMEFFHCMVFDPS
ncbi:GNAT family N-acetyltransferase [Paenibacillus sp. LHD-117]|uniref:GNAT family N-acetyltransferase n=1 Tax=Paenibacillus sp. LHD-117 TaxID=3071412 RepID=UPI0027E11166|nr:GNAT family N-acetyltransferase [Paenibacillus sp. LHD-117]MDQ6422227.1 GNAT family N-acetyltransferase [Paenibacillus sp. LHD-117]